LPLWARILRALLFLGAFFLALFLGFLALTILPGLAGALVAIPLFLAAAYAIVKVGTAFSLEPLDGGSGQTQPIAHDLPEGLQEVPDQGWEKARMVLAEHGEALADRPSQDRRMELLQSWRQSIDERAHDYADWAAQCASTDQVAALHGEAIMIAWSLGYAAARGWIALEDADMSVATLGRALRDQAREMGLRIEALNSDLPLVVDEALAAIVAMGREDEGLR